MLVTSVTVPPLRSVRPSCVVICFAPVSDVYEIFGRQAGTIGGKEALGYTCAGLYHALLSQADGGYDPDTGSCTTISTAYRFDGVPAFVAR